MLRIFMASLVPISGSNKTGLVRMSCMGFLALVA